MNNKNKFIEGYAVSLKTTALMCSVAMLMTAGIFAWSFYGDSFLVRWRWVFAALTMLEAWMTFATAKRAAQINVQGSVERGICTVRRENAARRTQAEAVEKTCA
jgi:uncharacterized membrane protein